MRPKGWATPAPPIACSGAQLIARRASIIQAMRAHLATLVEDFRQHAAETAVVAHRGNRRYATTYGELASLAGRFSAELARRGGHARLRGARHPRYGTEVDCGRSASALDARTDRGQSQFRSRES